MGNEEWVAAVEAAMVAIRRRTRRRTLALRAPEGAVARGGVAVQDVLDALEQAGEAGHPASVGTVADALAVDQPRASKLVAAAVSAGLVRREADQSDGRRSRVVLTPPGRDQLDRVHQYRRDAFARAMTGWTGTEQAEFARLLTRFVAALDEVAS